MSPRGESVKAKYARLLEIIKFLESIRRKYSRAAFLKNEEAQWSTVYNLVIGVEAITDIGNHILASRFQDYAENYKDILRKLGEHRVVPKALTERTVEMADFRNFAIHVYEGLSIEKVYDILQDAPADFRAYAKALFKHVK